MVIHIHKRPGIITPCAQAAIGDQLLADLLAGGVVGVVEHLVGLVFWVGKYRENWNIKKPTELKILDSPGQVKPCPYRIALLGEI